MGTDEFPSFYSGQSALAEEHIRELEETLEGAFLAQDLVARQRAFSSDFALKAKLIVVTRFLQREVIDNASIEKKLKQQLILHLRRLIGVSGVGDQSQVGVSAASFSQLTAGPAEPPAGIGSVNATPTLVMDNVKILIVEDNLLNSDLLKRRLSRAGVTTLCAMDGPSGIQMARMFKPDIIIMDIMLGDMDGWEATRILKADSQTAGIPIVILTAYDLPEYRQRSVQEGCDEFETKPVDFQRLISKIGSLLANDL